MKKVIAVLPGDGIGPEVMDEAIKVLTTIGEKFEHEFVFNRALVGGAAYDEYQNHLPKETLQICEEADAILFGSVGGPVDKLLEPKWKNCETNALLGIRKHFKFNINLRPVKVYESLAGSCVLRKDIVEKGIDILCVRELGGGIYFGKHHTFQRNGLRAASDEMVYSEAEIKRIAHAAFKAAMARDHQAGHKVTSVDKANVLDCSKLWREVMIEVSKEYPDCELEHVLVDNMTMQVLRRPSDFNVVVTSNMFGDIISDEVSVFAGSLGMLPSASLNAQGFGLYEPSGGSAPDLAGKGLANPIAQILSAAMMLKYSFEMDEEHDLIVGAIARALADGYRTGDIAHDATSVSTEVMGEAIIKYLH
jgi:3-isopropylmalate dehydrogenase